MKLAFVTVNQYPPNFGGIAGGNKICQQEASAAGLPGQYDAWLSDDNLNSPSITFVQPAVPYVNLVDALIASNWANLTSGTLSYPMDVFPSFSPPLLIGADAGLSVWTGTNYDGTYLTGYTCNSWTNNTSGFASVGSSGATNSEWTYNTFLPCNSGGANLYCFQQ